MKRLFQILISFFILLACSDINAQSIKDIKINEVLLYNDSGIVDEYQNRSPWIELFNTAYNSVNIGGCYLSNDASNPQKFKILKSAPNAIIGSRDYSLFWADSDTLRGVNHLNFTLKEGDFLGFYDADGNLIDSLTIQVSISNVSYGCLQDGSNQRGQLKQMTPKGNNTPEEMQTSSQKFKKLDPFGIGMAVIAMSVVFLSLIILYLVFKQIGLKFQQEPKKKTISKTGKHGESEEIYEETSGDVYAAIGLALHIYTSELHDFEEAVLTINKVSRSYSPWSSKIYGLRQNPDKK